MEDVIEQLLQQQAVIQQLQIEMAAKDQKTKVLEQNAQAFRQEIKALQQRSIYRCERGELVAPNPAFIRGSGFRFVDLAATFNRTFQTTPVVTVCLNYLANLSGTGLRVNASVISVCRTHMSVRIATWANTRLYSAGVYWMACA
ncbi:uncharacterized protein LOC144862449 [Branchiostoma floridae x Branchiostoma japonicum]